MARISKPPEERRQELIQAAQELFMQQGYEKTMVGDIVRRVGVAQGLFYYYFRSKQDIFLAVINQYTEERIGELAVSLRDTSIPMLDRVRNLLHVLMAFLREMDVMYPKNRGEMASEMSAITASHVSDMIEPMITELLSEGAAQGLLSAPYPDLLGRFIISGFVGVQNMQTPPKANEMMALIVFALQQLLGLPSQALGSEEANSGGNK